MIIMGEKIKLSEIYLGDVDGETEVAKCKNFYDLFYCRDEIIDGLINGNKYVIIGRKGTGKTLLSYFIKSIIDEKGNNYHCKICGSSDINLQKLLDIGESSIPADQMGTYWEYTLYKLIANMLIQKETGIKRFLPFSNIKYLRRFLEKKSDMFKLIEYTDSHSISSMFKGSLNKVESETSSSLSYEGKYVHKKFYDRLEKLKLLVEKNLKGKQTILIIDELDCLDVSSKMDRNYSICIASLINTAKKINNEFTKINDCNSKIIILIRNDIIDYLNENDSNINKAIGGKDIELDWWNKVDDDSPYEHPLIEMLLLKVRNSNEFYMDKTNKEIYKMIFPKEVEGKSIINYLLDNSFGRPRDVISFLNIIKEKEKNSYYFDPKYFKKYKSYYSKAFFDELKNEISIHEKSAMLNDSIKLLRDYKKTSFIFHELEKYFNLNQEYYPNIVNFKEAVRALYYQGVIGNVWTKLTTNSNGKVCTKSFVSWSYRNDSDPEPNFTNKFIVHKALIMSLSIK